MKKSMVFLLGIAMAGCWVQKDIEVNMVVVKLVKIDTVHRLSSSEQLLTWKCSDNMEYISYRPLSENYQLGSRMVMMIKR